MAVITIPSGYSERTHPKIIPICINDTDKDGNLVHAAWISHGAAPALDGLVKIAKRLLFDSYRASEISEYAVHSLSRVHGENLGEQPSVKVLNRARLHAVDLRAGGRRARRSLDVELFAETLDTLEENYDFLADLMATESLDKIVEQLDLLGLDRIKEMVPYMLRNADGRELSSVFGEKRNTITTRFYRGMRKAAAAAGVSRY